MPIDRRYTPEEIAAIFQDAAEAQEASGRGLYAGGLSLAEIQAIGAEEGLDPAFVAQAAARLDLPRTPTTRVLGLPTSVAHTVVLPAPLSDAAWERLVAAFRRTFDARGRTAEEGAIRSWRNGNLRITSEPTGDGRPYLHFRSRNQQMQGSLAGGSMVAAMAVVLLVVFGLLVPGNPSLIGFGLMLLIGLVMAGVSALNLHPWRDERQAQFEALGQQAVALVAEEAGITEATTSAASTGPSLSLDDLPEADEEAPGRTPGVRIRR